MYLGVCDDEGMLSFPSESDDEESVFRGFLTGAFGLGFLSVVAGVGLGGSFLMLGFREPLVAALGRRGTSGAGSLSTLRPPLGSSTTGSLSGFLGCFLPVTFRLFVPPSLCAGDFCRPLPLSAPFWGALDSLLGVGADESFELPPWLL